MSVTVDLADLAGVLDDFDTAYLMSTGRDRRGKVLGVRLQIDGDTLLALNGSRGTAANLAENPEVTGFSGKGFKMAPAIGSAVAELVTGGRVRLPESFGPTSRRRRSAAAAPRR